MTEEEVILDTIRDTLNHSVQKFKKEYGDTIFETVQPHAEIGEGTAQLILAGMYFFGNDAIQHYVLAHKWANLAVLNGEKAAIQLRDTVTKMMNREQIAEAQKMAQEWMKENKNA